MKHYRDEITTENIYIYNPYRKYFHMGEEIIGRVYKTILIRRLYTPTGRLSRRADATITVKSLTKEPEQLVKMFPPENDKPPKKGYYWSPYLIYSHQNEKTCREQEIEISNRRKERVS